MPVAGQAHLSQFKETVPRPHTVIARSSGLQAACNELLEVGIFRLKRQVRGGEGIVLGSEK